MKKLILILTGLVLFFTTCKKENKTTPDPSANQGSNNSTADFTITPSNINYAIGSTWVYEVVTIDDYYTNGVLNPSQSITTTSTYTVTASKDTVISSSITGKIFRYDAPGLDQMNNYIKGVTFYDPSNLKCHEIVYQKINGGNETFGCLGIDMPLTSSAKWQSNHSSHSSTANDSCFAIGYENISSGLGNIKCIKFHNKDQSTVFWYNNIYGKVKTANFSYQIINWAQTTTKTITNTLISFHQ